MFVSTYSRLSLIRIGSYSKFSVIRTTFLFPLRLRISESTVLSIQFRSLTVKFLLRHKYVTNTRSSYHHRKNSIYGTFLTANIHNVILVTACPNINDPMLSFVHSGIIKNVLAMPTMFLTFVCLRVFACARAGVYACACACVFNSYDTCMPNLVTHSNSQEDDT